MARRLKFWILKAVQKLYEEVKKKRQRDEVLSSSTPEFVELKSLWQLTSTDQSVVARAAGQVWLQLVIEGLAEFSYVLNGLLNQVPTAKNLQGLIETVSHLLQIQLILTEQTGSQYECPYNIRSPPHPFISILTTRPSDSWVLLLQEVSLMFGTSDKRVSSNAVAVLDPFLRFVFLQPKQPEEYAGLRSGLMSALVTVVMETEGVRQQVFDYLVGMLQGLQISTPSSLFEVSQFSISLLQLLPTCPSLLGESTQKLVNFSLSLSSRCHVNNISFTSLTQRIFTLGRTYPQCLHDNSNLAVIGQLMLKTYFLDNASLLNIVKLILKTKPGLPPLSVGMVLLPVLNILATPKMATLATQHKLMTSLASDVIALVESYKVQMKEKV